MGLVRLSTPNGHGTSEAGPPHVGRQTSGSYSSMRSVSVMPIFSHTLLNM